MKAQELIIGNWVNISISSALEQQVIDVMCDCVNTKYHECISYDFVEPIPLTEEWLLKFGFEAELKNADSKNGRFMVYTKYPITFNTNHGWWLYSMKLNVQPEYVHQLQNLYYALTGEELCIK